MSDRENVRLIDWPLRPWILSALLGMAGLLINFASDWSSESLEPWRAALVALSFFGPLAFSFTIEPDRWKAPLGFAVLIGAVMAGIAWRVARAEDHYADEGYWLAAGIVSIALALPLFQAGFHKLRWRTPYDETHFHVWTDAISTAGAVAFLGLSWALLFLLAQLFAAIEIDLLRDLTNEAWFGWLFSGVTFGAALGVLRNQLRIIGTLQSVVMLVFSLIAVPFAAALIVFLLAVVLSGLDVLWGATRSPTPLLLSCAAASFVLVNSVVRNGDDEAGGNRVLHWAALLLALGILPLAIMASISTGTRIAEYGLSPERIWGLIAIVVAVAYGVAYFVAPIRGRMTRWMERVRSANLHLAVATCVLAFVLSLPLLDFGAVAARDQLARLESGQVEPDDFDFAALRWDFGDAGREALAVLADSSNATVANLAKGAQAQTTRTYRNAVRDDTRDERLANLRMQFSDPELQNAVRSLVRDTAFLCNQACVALDLGPAKQREGRGVAIVTGGYVKHEIVDLRNIPQGETVQPPEIELGLDDKQPEVGENSAVEIREWTGRQIYVDGKPLGEPFE